MDWQRDFILKVYNNPRATTRRAAQRTLGTTATGLDPSNNLLAKGQALAVVRHGGLPV
jgi:hypothetical protein